MANNKNYDSTYSILLDILNEVEQGGGSGTGIPDAPVDGKTYGRNNAKWVEVTSGGGSAEPPIEVVVPLFDLTTDPATLKYDITPEDKLANVEAAKKITATINAGKSPNIVVRDNRKRVYFTPWKVNIYAGKVGFVAMQELYGLKREIVGYNIEADGSVTVFASWKGADERYFKTINGNSIIGTGDIQISGGGGGGIQKIKAVFRVPDFDTTTGEIRSPLNDAQIASNVEAYKIVEANFASNKDNMDVIILNQREFYPMYPDKVNFFRDLELIYTEVPGQQISVHIGADGNVVGKARIFDGISDAPVDGNQYARRNGMWTIVTGGAGGGVPEAPDTGLVYGRTNIKGTGEWVETATKQYVDDLVGAANNKLNLI